MQRLPQISLVVTIITLSCFAVNSFGDVLSDLDQQLQTTQQQLSSTISERKNTSNRITELENLKKQYEGTLGSIQNNYQLTQSQLQITEESLDQKNTEIEETNTQINKVQESIDERYQNIYVAIRQIYMSQPPTWLNSIISINDYGSRMQGMILNHSVTTSLYTSLTQLKAELKTISEIKDVLEQIKTELANQKNILENQQRSLQNQIAQTQQQISSAQNEMQNLMQALSGYDQTISSLTQRQRDILAAKAAAALASTSVGNIEINQAAISKSPPQDGNVYFSFWTYGYPHRVGMNQYGAFGRSQTGQTYNQILAAYYQNTQIVDWNVPATITITTSSGNQTIPFEDNYLLGIGEMPSCWGEPDRKGMEALKAQAIAARTYALYSTNNGQSAICTDQRCQVYVGLSKITGACGEYWKQAVEETRGKVLTYGGNLILAVYASTAGGYTINSADAQPYFSSYKPYLTGIKDADASGNYFDGPSYGDSPWFHKSWGDNPWLSIAQVTNLFNSTLLPETYNDQLALISADQVNNILIANGIEPVTSFNAIEVVDQNNISVNPNIGPLTANSSKVRVYYQDGKVAEVTADRFKYVFNLVSPGTDALFSSRFDVITAAQL